MIRHHITAKYFDKPVTRTRKTRGVGPSRRADVEPSYLREALGERAVQTE